METNPQLKQIAEIQALITKGTVTPEQLRTFLNHILGFIKKHKDDFATISQENLAAVKAAMDYIERCKNEMDGKSDNCMEDLTKKIDAYGLTLAGAGNKYTSDFDKKFNDAKEYINRAILRINNVENKPISDDERKRIVKEAVETIKKLEEPEDIREIIDAINELPIDDDDLKIDASHIKNLPILKGGYVGIGGARSLARLNDVNVKNVQDGDTLVYDAATKTWIPGPGGSGGTTLGFETPVGDIDGVNVEYTVTNTPLYVVLNGMTYFEDDGYTLSGLTITMLVVPETGSTLRSAFNS